jgi:hypothetical protein
MRRIAIVALLILGGCSSEPAGPKIRDGDRLNVAVMVPLGSGLGLLRAAEDLGEALKLITGATRSPDDPVDLSIMVLLDDGAGGQEQCYRISRGADEKSIEIHAAGEVGAMYGIYRVAADLGVKYIHPEETYYPFDPGARLPWRYDGEVECPGFELRGFHDHTQHPIVMSDFLLRTDRADFKDYVDRYLRWLARNRQNMYSFHMLKTVDVPKWLPRIEAIVDEAHIYGIKMGMVVSFVDQQQNNFKLINEDGQTPDDVQIQDGLDTLLRAGFDFFTFQIGSSEFTKPPDQDVLFWLDTAAAHLQSRGAGAYTWIHITCSLEDDRGGYFFHLPLQADPAMGAWVHTVMFYSLKDPAPVYDCERFEHQSGFMAVADGQREMVFFPETAWWLGFDNNAPLMLPITGWSRYYDIAIGTSNYDVGGHITFTSGREWTYWQYDHFLTRATWDRNLEWEEYLEWIKPVYERHGGEAVLALKKMTELQMEHFYRENPQIFFYLSGELPQDEIGAAAGITSRPPKLAFQDVVRFSQREFGDWRVRDYLMLESMRGLYRKVVKGMPKKLGPGSKLSVKLYDELYNSVWVFHQRVEHAYVLYTGAIAVRDGDEALALEKLAEARAISAEVIEVLQAMEKNYRYPLDLLCREKPESLTSYKYGYLYETSTGYFWTRRDDQLETLIQRTFQSQEEKWEVVPEVLFYTDKDHIEMIEPASETAADAIRGFMPRLLYGLADYSPAGDKLTLCMAQDSNENLLPDPGPQDPAEMACDGSTCVWTSGAYSIAVSDSTGEVIGELGILDPVVTLTIQTTGGQVSGLSSGEMVGTVGSQALIGLVMTVGGIDEEGVTNLLKSVYEIPEGEDLPPTLPFSFRMTYVKVEQ